jgi:hypothetical protein
LEITSSRRVILVEKLLRAFVGDWVRLFELGWISQPRARLAKPDSFLAVGFV